MANEATKRLIGMFPQTLRKSPLDLLYKVQVQPNIRETPKHRKFIQRQVSNSIDGLADITLLSSVVVTPSLAQRDGARDCVRPEDHASDL